MYEHACFRVSVDEVSADFKRFADLARTRTFEIYDEGKVDVLLVRLDAVKSWHRKLQVSIPTELMTEAEVAQIRKGLEGLNADLQLIDCRGALCPRQSSE